jgi:hypothetical protein
VSRNVVIGLVVLALVAVGIALLTGGGDDGGGGDGDALALGETAVLEYAPTTDSGELGDPTTLAVTVTAVRAGTQEELKQGGLEVDAEDQGATPYYVDARYENRGQAPVDRGISVSLEGPDGESLPSTVVFDFGGEPFELCRDVSEGTLAPGESFEDCTLVLVPEGDEVDTALFVSQTESEIVLTRWDASSS